MEITFFLAAIIFVLIVALLAVWFKTQNDFTKIFEQALDAMAQKNAGVYYPKDLREQDLIDEKEKSDMVDLNEISDDEFRKAMGMVKEPEK
jgi:uncharacterized protein HemX